MKLRGINLPWNMITGRKRRDLVLPNGQYRIPTAEVTLPVELIEGFKVLRKMVLGDKWCFVIADDRYGVVVVAFDDYGNAYDASMSPEHAREIGPTGHPKVYWEINK